MDAPMEDWNVKLKMRLPALLLLLVTVLFWSRYDRYEPVGPILLEGPVLADGTNIRGAVSEIASRFILKVPRGGKQARINFHLPAATHYESIRVRARIKVGGVVVGKYSWHCARLLVTQYDANNKWISGPHGLVAEKGTQGWALHEDVFEIFPNAARADVILQQAGLAGWAEFDRITAQPVRIRASFDGWRILFLVLWIGLAIFYFPRCRLNRRRLKGLIFLNAIVILAGTLMPGDWIASGTEKAKAALQEVNLPELPSQNRAPAGKKKEPSSAPLHGQMDWFAEVQTHQIGHFMLFASLCFLVYCSAALERQHPAYFFKVGLDILLFAAITEALQFLTLDRTAGILDLRTDLYGMAAALVIFLVVRPVFLKRG